MYQDQLRHREHFGNGNEKRHWQARPHHPFTEKASEE